MQKFVVGGWFILGPDTNILTLTILLISAPSALFNVFVAIQLRDWSLVRPRRNPAHGPTLTPWRTPRTRARRSRTLRRERWDKSARIPVHATLTRSIHTNSPATLHPTHKRAYITAQPSPPLLFQSA